MQTTQLIEASATVVTISTFKAGDVYKRIAGSDSDPQMVFGVVQDVVHNGSEGAITALELTRSPSYYTSSGVVDIKVFKTGMHVALFAATPMEFQAYVNELRALSASKLKAAEQALEAAEKSNTMLEQVISTASAGTLTAPDVLTGDAAVQHLQRYIEGEKALEGRTDSELPI